MVQTLTRPKAQSEEATFLITLPEEIILPAEIRSHKQSLRGLVRDDVNGHYYKHRERYLYHNWMRDRATHVPIQKRILGWLRAHVYREIPRLYYRLMLGHDIHLTTFAELFSRHFHYAEPDPFTGKMEYHDVNINGVLLRRAGWWENRGLWSRGFVCEDWRDLEAAAMKGDATPYADFKEAAYHRVGSDSTAEASSDSDLVVDVAITTAQGSQEAGASAAAYKTISTITADAAETWNEHCVRTQTGSGAGTMLDRSVQPGSFTAVSVQISDTVEFTYEITKTAES